MWADDTVQATPNGERMGSGKNAASLSAKRFGDRQRHFRPARPEDDVGHHIRIEDGNEGDARSSQP